MDKCLTLGRYKQIVVNMQREMYQPEALFRPEVKKSFNLFTRLQNAFNFSVELEMI